MKVLCEEVAFGGQFDIGRFRKYTNYLKKIIGKIKHHHSQQKKYSSFISTCVGFFSVLNIWKSVPGTGQ